MSEHPVVQCPDCRTPMEIGCFLDVSHGGARTTRFLPGVPSEEKLFGLIKTGGVEVDWKKTVPVTVFRCPDCGLLKSYVLRPPVKVVNNDDVRDRLGDS